MIDQSFRDNVVSLLSKYAESGYNEDGDDGYCPECGCYQLRVAQHSPECPLDKVMIQLCTPSPDTVATLVSTMLYRVATSGTHSGKWGNNENVERATQAILLLWEKAHLQSAVRVLTKKPTMEELQARQP